MSEQTDSGEWVSCFDDFDTHNRQAGARRFWQVVCVLLAKSHIEILVFLFASRLLIYYRGRRNALRLNGVWAVSKSGR